MSEILFISCAVGLALALGIFLIANFALGEERRRESDQEERARMKRFMEKYARFQDKNRQNTER